MYGLVFIAFHERNAVNVVDSNRHCFLASTDLAKCVICLFALHIKALDVSVGIGLMVVSHYCLRWPDMGGHLRACFNLIERHDCG